MTDSKSQSHTDFRHRWNLVNVFLIASTATKGIAKLSLCFPFFVKVGPFPFPFSVKKIKECCRFFGLAVYFLLPAFHLESDGGI